MATPVIDPTVSHLGYKQWETWNYQPTATNLTASGNVWTAIGLPAGMSINASSGLISGAAQVAGVYNVRMRVVNGNSEASAEVYFPIVIAAAANTLHTGLDLSIDVETGEVTGDSAVKSDNNDNDNSSYLFGVKTGDDILMVIQWKKGNTVVAPDIEALQLTLKQYEPEGTVAVGNVFTTGGSGQDFYARLHCAFTADALASAVADNEADDGSYFFALAEIEWIEGNATGTGPNILRRTSRTFRVRVERGLGQVSAA